MFRRSNGRSPPLLLGGLLLALIVLSYCYWTLNIQNSDTLHNLEQLQASLKLGEVKMEQNERKMNALQDQLHDKEETLNQHKSKLFEQENNIKDFNSNIKRKEFEITSFKKDLESLKAQVAAKEEKLAECHGENERLQKESDLLISQRDDAVNALNKRDEQIANLERKFQQEHERNVQLEANMNMMRTKLSQQTKDQVLNMGTGDKMKPKSSSPPAQGHKNEDMGVVPKPVADDHANDVHHQPQQNVLPQPLKHDEGDSEHQNLPSGNMHPPPLNDKEGLQDQQFVVVAPPKAKDKVSSKSFTPSDSPKNEAKRLAGFHWADTLPRHVIFQPSGHDKSAIDALRPPKAKTIGITNHFNNHNLVIGQQPPIALYPRQEGLHPNDVKRLEKAENTFLESYHQMPPSYNQANQPVKVPNSLRQDQFPQNRDANFKQRNDFEQLQQAIRLLNRKNEAKKSLLKAPLHGANNRHIAEVGRQVLQPPPDFDNLDTAIDEGNQLGEDPLMPDQDPEGQDVAVNEKLLHDDRVHENRVHDEGPYFPHDGSPLKDLDNHGGEVDTGIKEEAGEADLPNEDEDNNDNFAKENFFDDQVAPLKLSKMGNNDFRDANSLDDKMVL